jgi:hypothetical protein
MRENAQTRAQGPAPASNSSRTGLPAGYLHLVPEMLPSWASMPLSYDAVLVFVLQSGCVGRLTFGRVERNDAEGLKVYSPYPHAVNHYISGSRVRSWCVIGPDGKHLSDWHSVRPEDRDLVSSAAA